jgi:uncharacterized protein (DUF2345 family)
MKFQAKQDLKIVSANAHVDFAAAKKIHLAVKGGASITIDGGITVQCPGTITVHASKKSFSGPVRMSYALPLFEHPLKTPCAGNYTIIKDASGLPLEGYRYRVQVPSGQQAEGVLSKDGITRILGTEMPEPMTLHIALLKENQRLNNPYLKRSDDLGADIAAAQPEAEMPGAAVVDFDLDLDQ